VKKNTYRNNHFLQNILGEYFHQPWQGVFLSLIALKDIHYCFGGITHHPYTIIFHAFPLLYLDPDVSFHEAKNLFSLTFSTIKKLTRTYQLITLITNPFSHHRCGGETLHQMLFDCCDELICIRQMKHCPRVELPRYHAAATLTQGTSGQLCLQDFGMVV
jgi:hypothetical protein